MKTLIIEDSQTIVRILTKILNKLGISDIEQTDCYSSAVLLMKKDPYLITFVDWDLKTDDGRIVVYRLRQEFPDLCIVVVANSSQKSSVLSAAKAGANHYIVRPISEDNVRAKLESFISEHAPEPEDDEHPTF